MSTAIELAKRELIHIEHDAFHEAGHAIAAAALGIEVQSTGIRCRRRGYRGITWVFRGSNAMDDAIVCLAGPESSRRWCPDDFDVYGMDADFENADRHIDAAAGDRWAVSTGAWAIRRASISIRVKAAAAALIERHWPEVQALAGKLLVSETVDGANVKAIFEQSLRERGGRP